MADNAAAVSTDESGGSGRLRSPRVLLAMTLAIVVILVAGGAITWMVTRTPHEDTPVLTAEGRAKLQLRAVLIEAPLLPGAAPDTSAAAPSIAAPLVRPTDSSDMSWIDNHVIEDFVDLQSCPTGTDSTPPAADIPTFACATSTKYVLGPTELTGSAVKDITVVSQPGGYWAVELSFTAEGMKTLTAMTSRMASLPDPRGQLAVVVGNHVLSTSRVMEPITGATLQLAAGPAQTDAIQLAHKLTAGEP